MATTGRGGWGRDKWVWIQCEVVGGAGIKGRGYTRKK